MTSWNGGIDSSPCTAQHMIEKKLISQEEGNAMIADWLAHRANPNTLFFSPIVVDAAVVVAPFGE
jgi:hypothetical protein